MPHYTSLNKLLTDTFPTGLAILGFPCNQFGGQEPAANGEIADTLFYVRPGGGFVPAFPLTQKVDVNGFTADPMWANIRAACPSPVDTFIWAPSSWVPVTPRDVGWNFETVLAGKDGMLYRRYATAVDPADLAGDIAYLLALLRRGEAGERA